MRRPGWAFGVEALLLLLVLPRAAGGTAFFSRRRSLQVLTDGETVLNGVLNLFTEEGVAACEGSCKDAFATAFGIDEVSVGCVCPMSTSASDADRRRNLMGDNKQATSDSAEQNNGGSDRRSLRAQRRRWLAETDSSEPVAFSARVAGGLAGGAAALDLLSESGWSAVASAFGVDEDELEISTLTVTPPASTNSTEALEVITDYFDASDISIVSSLSTTEGTDWAGGGRGVALFLALFVLLLMTFCCCGFLAGLLLWKAPKHGGGAVGAENFFKSHLPERNSFRWGEQPTADGNPRRSEPHSSEGASPNGPLLGLVDSQDSSNRSPSRESVPHEGDEAAGGGVDHRRATSASSAAVAPESSSTSRGVSGGDLGKELESPSAAGRGGITQQTAAAAAAAAPAATAGGRDEEGAIPRNVSMEESVGTNPLYKTAAPYSRSTNESQSEQTPGRSRFSTFLGNATPSRLRRLASRVAKSPALSASSRRSKPSSASRHSRSGGSSTRSRRHRRQGSFPGAYSQRNSSELDHQRPPADPVYTFMIKTIAAKGFKFMTTTEIAFCAMRMYSHFRRTEGNYKRLTVMQNAENVPPVYEIIWQCGGTSEGNPEGESRFFSSTSGTDAEQQKSLLACLLALSWDGSTSSRKTLQRALTPTRPSKVPLPEDIFWDEFKDSTDALSGDDEMVVVARMVLLVAESANKPGQDGVSSGASSSGVPPEATAGGGEEREKEGIEHGDIMQALSGAHLREIGIAIKEARPGWQEAHVQLVSVLLVMAYLEEGAKNTLPGGDRPDPLSSLEWVNLLTPEALDAFLVEKLEARRALVELDLEPSGLVIRHDDHGVVERVEPAVEEKKTSSWIPSRGHQQILPKSSSRSRKGRGHRRSRSVESGSSTGSKPSPVVITTVHGRKDKKSGGTAGGTSTSSAASADSSFKAGGGDRSSLRTVSQQRPRGSSSEKSSSAAGGGGGDGGGGDNVPPKLTIDAGAFAVRVPVKGTSVRSELSRGLSPAGSQASSVVTRVYAPSSVGGGDQARSPDVAQAFASPTNESAMSQVSIAASRFLSSPVNNPFGPQFRGQSASSGLTGVSAGTAAGSGSGVVPVGAARKDMGFSQDLSGLTPTRTGRGGEDGARSPGAFSVAGRSEAGFSDAASRYDNSFAASRESGVSLAGRVGLTAGTAGGGGGGPPTPLDDLAIQQPSSPNSAAASRFDTSSPASATTFTSRVGVGSPTAAPAGAGGRARVGAGGPLTGRSAASSMRSDGGSSFFKAGGSQRSGDSRGMGGAGSASASSWDEEDLQNMGTRWLADRAYNQQFDAQK